VVESSFDLLALQQVRHWLCIVADVDGPMIVWLASFPRSGNSFFRLISKNLFGQNIYSIYPEKKLPVNETELLKMTQDSRIHLVKTHELPSDSNPAIYLVRDGRDALVSLAWFYLESQASAGRDISQRQFNRKLKKEILSRTFGGWSKNCLSWIQRPGQTAVIRFEDLTSDPVAEVAKAFGAVGLASEKREFLNPPTFDELHLQNPVLFRKGKVGGWKEHMPEKLHRLFWKKHGEAMRLLGYGE
jgi:hypothetical protein